MHTSRIPSLNTTLQKTDDWLDEIKAEIGIPDERLAYQALRSVLHSLRDRLTVDMANALSAELPMLIRGLYFEGWKPSRTPVKTGRLKEFHQCVARAYRGPPRTTPATMTSAVLRVLTRNCEGGLVDKIRATLPEALRSMLDDEAPRQTGDGSYAGHRSRLDDHSPSSVKLNGGRRTRRHAGR